MQILFRLHLRHFTIDSLLDIDNVELGFSDHAAQFLSWRKTIRPLIQLHQPKRIFDRFGIIQFKDR